VPDRSSWIAVVVFAFLELVTIAVWVALAQIAFLVLIPYYLFLLERAVEQRRRHLAWVESFNADMERAHQAALYQWHRFIGHNMRRWN
jgi:hypothetical protein